MNGVSEARRRVGWWGCGVRVAGGVRSFRRSCRWRAPAATQELCFRAFHFGPVSTYSSSPRQKITYGIRFHRPDFHTRICVRPVAKVLVATTAMLAFISFWRAAAIVLNDLASSAYYAGGEAEQFIGKTAPWFILGIMLFSYAVRAIYVESCSMFVRGGVYRVVKEAMGGTLAKFSVSALMFDYVLTGPDQRRFGGAVSGGSAQRTVCLSRTFRLHLNVNCDGRRVRHRWSRSISGGKTSKEFRNRARRRCASCRSPPSWWCC